VPAVLTLVLSCSLTFIVFSRERASLRLKANDHFAADAREVSRRLLERLQDDAQILKGARGLFAASQSVSRAEFRKFVATLDFQRDHPGIQGVGFSEWIPATRREAVVGRVRGEGYPDFEIRPAGRRDVYTSIVYLEPLDWRNQRAFGFDMYTEPTRRAAMARARDEDGLFITGKVTLLQETEADVQNGILMYLPVYASGEPVKTPEERRKAIRGFVYSPIRMGDLVRGVFGKVPSRLAFEIDDFEENDRRRETLFQSHPSKEGESTGTFAFEETRPVFGRLWRFSFTSLPKFDAAVPRTERSILLSGGVFSLLLSVMVLMLSFSRERALAAARKALMAKQWTQLHLERTPLAVIEWSLDGRVTAWNPAAHRLFGFTREEALGRHLAELLSPSAREDGQSAIPIFAQPAGGLSLPVEHLAKGGQVVSCEWYNTVLKDAAGEPLGMASLVLDVSERHLLEKRLREAQKLESLGVLAGGIAHDFNNLLTGVIGNVSLAREVLSPEAPDAAKESLRKAEIAALRAADLTSQMLAYSGRGRFVVGPIELGAVVNDMIELLRSSISKKALLRVEASPGLPIITGDVTQIRQVVMNLITNASEALLDQSGNVSLRLSSRFIGASELAQSRLADVPPEGHFVCLEVVDSGCGMDAHVCDRLFDPFFTTKVTGRGLGLAAVLGIIRGHRGAIWVQSEPSRGTTFLVAFPASGAAERAVIDPPGDFPPVPEHHSGRVLLADDEETVRSVARLVLEREGYTVTEARDGEEALRLARAAGEPFDLGLLDVTMPVRGGREIVRELRHLCPSIRVILMSGYDRESAMGGGEEGVPDAFLAKPFVARQLLTTVNELLQPANKTKRS
jgi:PAS domain S-box-containing protein